MSDFFKFEKDGIDFPFYNHIPKISHEAWLLILFAIPIAICAYAFIPTEFVSSIFFALIMLIPLLYVAGWDYKLFFQKPTYKEIGLAVLLCLGYLTYSLIMDYAVLQPLGIYNDGSGGGLLNVNVEMIISLVFSMLGEELIKFIPFIFLLRIFYKYSENRKASLIASSFIVMMSFGLMHLDVVTYQNTIWEVLLLQGLGSVFEFYGLIKTKNIVISYITHILTDFILMTYMLMGF